AYALKGEQLPILYGKTKDLELIEESEKANIHFTINPKENQIAESYELRISKQQIEIEAQDAAGLFYAFITLNQLMEDSVHQDQTLPVLSIKDAPKIAFRPIHLDVKHHREKESYYYELMDHLAQLKINGIILEIEDKLKYKRRPEIGSADALSIEQWKTLSDYAQQRNINISPLVQGLGHASFILKHEKNFSLRDEPESDWAFNPLDPETYSLQFDLYLDALEATPHGKYLHVGGDEVYTTGRNSGKSALELNLIWLNRVCNFAAKYNRIPIFWDDMPLKQAGLMSSIYDRNATEKEVDSIWLKNENILNAFIEQFPKNCIYMRWNYQFAESYGNGKAMDWFSNNGFNVMGATAGQTRWTLMPQKESNIAQIRIFADQSINRNYNGLLLTLWDDDSPHFELYKRGIAAFAEYSWGGMQRSISDFKSVFRHRTLGANFHTEEFSFIDDLDQPVSLWTHLFMKEGVHRNRLNSGQNPKQSMIIDLPDFNNKGFWSERYADRLKSMEENTILVKKVKQTLDKIQTQNPKNPYLIEIYQQVGALTNFNFKLMQAVHEFDMAKGEEKESNAIQKITQLKGQFHLVRQKLESVYGKTRILNKPDDYILDQDHHHHPANQTVNFDWQFRAELLFLEKVEEHFKTQKAWREGKQSVLE
ncbi:MAG: glycoside hydrolase family 20 zincin-like fold domain-containing protein, partial [Flavobacteriaceae bacterium]